MEWDPSRFFRPEGSPSPYALLMLNQPINERAFTVLSQHASYIICADGGANRLFDMMKAQGKESTEPRQYGNKYKHVFLKIQGVKHSDLHITQLPDKIIGDLDSIRPSVRQHYEKLNVSVVKDPDQYSTDFTKCLKYLNSHASEIIQSPRKQKVATSRTGQEAISTNESCSVPSPKLEIVILGGLGGRVDQAFSQIHHLYMMTQTQRQLQASSSSQDVSPGAGGNLYLISEESISFVLQEGKNIILTPRTNRPPESETTGSGLSPDEAGDSDGPSSCSEREYYFEENIGIIPLSAPASITTHGFEWDVEDWHTEIGGQISTSNHIRADKVEVSTNVPVLFTAELAQRLKRA
ncbi:Uncharacterized protein PECH_009011 [Penicillium ucsense]|uniref:Thiamin pyrophosphokinase thiamin-binding domain-containing protein n=1 Tax=Penicillium ucsense TaxID=2839758 RepID=A0A8J8W0C0_9EURO|nr:Uncharacterized protein PECM_008763 [Penicillium ucsense]KAF7733730.1 Uncharacterized protein PECH_009011 [Penicillium ucsense]